MKFKKRLLEPSYSRHADFTTLSRQENAYRFVCSQCSGTVEFAFSRLIGKEYSWEQALSQDEVAEIKSYFQVNVVGKSPDGGWPAFLKVKCNSCGAEFMVYAGINETSNSVYRVVVQSIAEMSRD